MNPKVMGLFICDLLPQTKSSILPASPKEDAMECRGGALASRCPL